MEKILTALARRSFDSLIDIGCGDGKVLAEVARKFPEKRLLGIDYSEKSLRFARAFSPHLPFATDTKEKFDAFVLVEVLEHINPSEMDSFLDSICGNLNEGGFGVITTPCDNEPVNPKHYQHFNKASIERTLERHFNIESFEYTSARNFNTALIQRLLANRFFILNEKHLVRLLYKFYKKQCLNATPQNATQVFVVVSKK